MNGLETSGSFEFEEKLIKLEKITKLFSMELFKRVIMKTPVQTGRARGNWQTSIDSSEKAVLETKDKNGSIAISKVAKEVNKFELGHRLYLTNNLPYIQKLEYGGYPETPKKGTGKTIGGYSKQAPKGMVRTSIQEMDTVFKDIVRENL